MMIVASILLAWTAACWFSGPFERPFLGLPLFGVDAAVPLAATLLWTLAALVIRALRSRAEGWRRLVGWVKQHRRILALLLLILFFHLLLELPSIVTYRGSNDSDSAIHGLAGYHIAEGKSRPMFRYRHNYVGSLIPHLAAALQLLFGKSPVYLRIVHAAFFIGFIVVLFALVRRLFDDRIALLAAALAAIPPYEVYRHLNHASLSATLFLGVLSLYLLSSMLDAERPSWRQYFWYGAVLGIGFWTHLMIVYFVATGALALFLRDKLFFVRPRFAAAPAGFLIGGTVTFVHSYYHNWIIFTHFFAQSTEPIGLAARFLPGISTFLENLPPYLGLIGDRGDGYPVFGPWLAWFVLAVFVLALVIYLLRCREQINAAVRLKNINVGPALFALFIPAVVIIFAASEYSAPPALMRYIYPLWIAIPVVIAVASFSAARWSRIAAAALAGVFIAVFLGSLAIKHLEIYERELVYQRWEEFCRRQGITRFYGQYWRSYLTSFFTAERIIGSDGYHTGHEPYSPYQQIVADSAEAPAFLFGPRERSRQAVLEATLRGLGIDYRTSRCSLGTVIHHLSERATARQLFNIRPGRREATFAGWTVCAVAGPAGSAGMRMLTLRIVNGGESAWRADGHGGHVELSLSAADGRELRRQPLAVDVEAGESVDWHVLLEAREAGAGPVASRVLLNDFDISQGKRPLLLDLEPAEGAEPVEAREIDAIRASARSDDGVEADYMFLSGWGAGATAAGQGVTLRWSGGDESTVGFFLAHRRPVRLLIRLVPFRGNELSRQPQLVRLLCNGAELPAPIYLPGARRVRILLPRRHLRAGLNRLIFRFGQVEPQYWRRAEDGAQVFRFRPRAVAFGRLRFRPASDTED